MPDGTGGQSLAGQPGAPFAVRDFLDGVAEGGARHGVGAGLEPLAQLISVALAGFAEEPAHSLLDKVMLVMQQYLCNCVCIGRLSVTERYLMPQLKMAVNKLSLNLVNNDTIIKVSLLGNKAGAVGASLLAKTRLLNNN